jgi:hypothetical protein
MRTIVCLLLCSFCFSQSNNNWQLYKSENGILVYSRKAENTNIKELKTIVYLKTSLNSIVALLNDWDSYPQWNYKCVESKTLKVISETELIHYQMVKIPWPADNQDFIINVKLSQEAKTKVITIKSTNNANYIPPFPDRTRIRELEAKWTLTPLKDGTVEAVYEFFVNPGGLIPAWILNTAVAYGPYETMLNFKEWVKKDKYQKAKNPLVKELNE